MNLPCLRYDYVASGSVFWFSVLRLTQITRRFLYKKNPKTPTNCLFPKLSSAVSTGRPDVLHWVLFII